MIDEGIFAADDRVELLDGWIVKKMTQNPPHAAALDMCQDALRPLLPAEWRLLEQKPVRMPGSQPEPDLIIVRGPVRRYAKRHPEPADIAVVLEVADTTVEEDRVYKGGLYARARIPVYWIINLGEAVVEVYTGPKRGKIPGYQHRRDYGKDDSIPLIVAGQELGLIPVSNLLA
jgi:Uma2 family endonuclease